MAIPSLAVCAGCLVYFGSLGSFKVENHVVFGRVLDVILAIDFSLFSVKTNLKTTT